MTENLLPCPFCGSKDLSITLSVTCNGCGARAAKVFWNTRLAAQADAPAIQPQRMRKTAAEAIRTFCKSLGNNVVVVSSDDVERIYYSGISVDALSAAIAIALTRPECGDGK